MTATTVKLARWIRGCPAAVAALAALVATVPSTAQADPPTRITIVAVFNPIAYGQKSYVNGQLFGPTAAGQVVGLEQSAPPFVVWTPVAQATTDFDGYYSFELRPDQTLEYRTNSEGIGSERVVQISVAPRISFTAVPAGRSSVRFSGTFSPALADESIAIQRRTRRGWQTISRARLRAGRTFAGRLRMRNPATLRAFYAKSAAHLPAGSRAVTVRPG